MTQTQHQYTPDERGRREEARNARLQVINAQLLEALEMSEILIAKDIIRDDLGCLKRVRAAIKAATQ